MSDNKNMPKPYFSIALILIVLLVYPLTLRLKVYYNAKKNTGKLQLKFFNLNVTDLMFSIHVGYIKFTNRKHRNFYLPIEFSEQAIQEYNNFQEILFKKTYFKKMAIYFNFGNKDNAFVSAMACGIVDIVTKILYSILKTKKSEVLFESKVYPNFNSNVIKIGLKAKISISIYDLLWSFLESKFSTKIKITDKREIKDARQQEN